MSMNPVESICEAYSDGYRAILLSGRSLYDLVSDDDKLRPLLEALRRELFGRFSMVVLTYSMAAGLDWDSPFVNNDSDRRIVERVLQEHRLTGISRDRNEVEQVVRGICSLVRRPSQDPLRWSDGRDVRFCVVVEFTEHLSPNITNGTQTDTQLLFTELSHLTAQSLALRSSGNLVIFHGREGLIDELVSSSLHPIRMQQPDKREKLEFLSSATQLYADARFEEGLTIDGVAHLTANTPNRGLEQLLRASHRSKKPLTARELGLQKNRDVELISENTLSALDTGRIEGVRLRGINIEKPRQILVRYAEALMKGERSMPANVLLAGPPGTGKTDLALLVARYAGVPAFQILNTKAGVVGETERKSRLQQTVLKEWAPNVGFIDEITEAFPMERSDFDGDSGASRAVMAEMLKAFSDESRRGKCLVVAATNCPWRMSEAMRSRFTFIPVLHPLRQDFPDIICAIAQSMPGEAITATNPMVREAADLFYDKGANPRHIRQALSNAVLVHGPLSCDSVLAAAHDLCATRDYVSVVYADLWAIMSCSSYSFFPWSGDSKNYPFPDHLKDLVDPETGMVNHREILKRIEEYRPHANV